MAHNSIAGSYSATWGGSALGRTENGFVIEFRSFGVPLTFEEWGEIPFDMVHRGLEVTVEGVFKEWRSAGLDNALWPWSNSLGKVGCPGDMVVDGETPISEPLVLTAYSCANASSYGGNVWTFHETIIDPEVINRINFDNNPRVVPIRFKAFMVATGDPAENRFFTIT